MHQLTVPKITCYSFLFQTQLFYIALAMPSKRLSKYPNNSYMAIQIMSIRQVVLSAINSLFSPNVLTWHEL